MEECLHGHVAAEIVKVTEEQVETAVVAAAVELMQIVVVMCSSPAVASAHLPLGFEEAMASYVEEKKDH